MKYFMLPISVIWLCVSVYIFAVGDVPDIASSRYMLFAIIALMIWGSLLISVILLISILAKLFLLGREGLGCMVIVFVLFLLSFILTSNVFGDWLAAC